MADEWRRKTYYNKRVLIDVSRVLDPQFDDSLICVTGAHFELLRNAVQYLRRRSTFVSEYHDGYYVAPSNAEWDELSAIVANLEEVLMGCTDITALLEAIRDCVCATADAIAGVPLTSPALTPIIEDYLDDGALIPSDTYAGDTVIDAKRCALAQLAFWQAWDLLTETIQPLGENTIDILLPAAMVALATMVGTPILGIPTGIFLALFWNIMEVWVDGEIAALQNAVWASMDELVCAVYFGLAVDYRTAEAEAVLVIAEIPGLSPIDKIILHALFAPWALALVAKAYDNNTDWALAHVEAGACDDCLVIEGDDWYAVRIPLVSGLVELDHPTDGGYWVGGCWEYVLAEGQTAQGVIWRMQSCTGNCILKRMASHGPCILGTGCWPDTSDSLTANERFFSVNGDEINEEQCKARLAPYSTTQEFTIIRSGPGDYSAAWHFGYACDGYCEAVIEWVVFRGTAP